jgi:steroid delta-isomerase-like uncharacterized protein
VSTEANKAVVRRYVEEVRNRGRYELVPELIAADYDVGMPGLPAGPEGFRAMDAETRTGFPDFQFTIEELIAEGDRVASHWTIHGTHLGPWRGVPPTGRPVVMRGISVFTVREGKIAGRYGYQDQVDVLRQLGVALPG